MLYKEVQRFIDNKVMLLTSILLILLFLFFAYGAIRQLFYNQSFGNQPMSNVGLVVSLVFIALLLWVFIQLRLVTQVSEKGVSVHFSLFRRFKRDIAFMAIKEVEQLSYNGLTDHGGWGWRVGPFGTAYTAYGNQAVKLTMHNQKTNLSKAVYIGTQDADALATAIKKHVD